MTLTLISVLASLFTRQGREEVPAGAAAVLAAINEMRNVSEGVFDAQLGEPDIERNEGTFAADPKIVVPIENTKYGDGGTLVYDVPAGSDIETQFTHLLDAFGLSLREMGKLEGKTVPVNYSGGNIIVMWDQLEREEGAAGDDDADDE